MQLTSLLATLLTITTAVIAVPTDAEGSVLVARKCPGTRYHWQGGGCEFKWGGECLNRCKNAAAGKGCCAGSVSRYEMQLTVGYLDV